MAIRSPISSPITRRFFFFLFLVKEGTHLFSRTHLRTEWDNLKRYDVLFLVTIDATYKPTGWLCDNHDVKHKFVNPCCHVRFALLVMAGKQTFAAQYGVRAVRGCSLQDGVSLVIVCALTHARRLCRFAVCDANGVVVNEDPETGTGGGAWCVCVCVCVNLTSCLFANDNNTQQTSR
jgi:hypothetical protein